MTWVWFALTGTVIVVAGTWLARYGDVIAVRTGLGRHWVGVVLVAATTSLPELFTGFGATAVIQAPNIAIGDVLGSCLFNLLLLSFMDVVQAERLSARAHQGHALTIGCGLALTAIAGLGIAGARHWPTLGWVGAYSPLLIAGYLLSIRATFVHERRRLSEGHRAVAETVGDGVPALRSAVIRYGVASVFVVGAALQLPSLAADLARQTGLGNAFVGSVLVAITTSLPELVVSFAAVRLGALDLAVGNVLGSNLFNLLILGLDDVFYRPGPILLAADASHLLSVLGVMLANAIFLIGLTQQVLTKRFRVAWDSLAIAGVYAATVWLLLRMHG